VANRNKGRHGRSRKRRASGVAVPYRGASGASPQEENGAAPPPAPGAGARARRPTTRARRSTTRAGARGSRRRSVGEGLKDLVPVGQRPPPPWHPLPLSELLILFGAIGTVVGFSRGISNGGAALFVGLAAVVIGTAEVMLREHLSGYRSHTLILAALPVIVLDAVIVLLIGPFTTTLKLVLVAIDVALFALLFKLLRARFLGARRERVLAGGR
jgi:hypothetical protein